MWEGNFTARCHVGEIVFCYLWHCRDLCRDTLVLSSQGSLLESLITGIGWFVLIGDFYGNTGVLHYMTSASDMQWLIDSGPHQPYIGLMEPQVFEL